MRNLTIGALLMLLTGLAIAQDVSREPASDQERDLFSAVQSDHSLSMFVTATQSSGLAKMLREEGPLTVFAPSDRAFVTLLKEDRETLISNRAAMRILLAHYIAHGSIPLDDTVELLSARTLLGVKLRTDIRGEIAYVNGAKLDHSEIPCANGVIYVLDSFDPGLVHEAVALAKTGEKGN